MLNLPRAAALAALALASCAVQRAQAASDAKTEMVGLNREQVLACMGPPAQKTAEGGTEVWTYSSGDGRVDTIQTASAYSTMHASGNPYMVNANSSTLGTSGGFSQRRFCLVNIVLNNGSVSTINYNGPTGGILTRGEQCGYAVANCVK